jgi:cell division septal protein FtsQ
MVRVAAATLPWPARWPEVRPRAWLARFVPTRRSLVLGFGILAFALGAYVLARETSLFAISRIEVRGGSPRVARQVHQALASLVGTPLVGLDGSVVVRRVDALPTVVRARYDRAFPHSLRITIVPERPAAVLRRGPDSWLVSARGRVIERLPSAADPSLPRIWVSGRTPVRNGAEVAEAGAGSAARAVGRAGAFAARVAAASYVDGALVFHLRSGIELLLGDGREVKVKVAVAARALAVLPTGSTFLDVSVPGRVVSGAGLPAVTLPQGSSRG